MIAFSSPANLALLTPPPRWLRSLHLLLVSSPRPSSLQMSHPSLSPAQTLGDQHLLTRQRINGKNVYTNLTGDSWYKHRNAMSSLLKFGFSVVLLLSLRLAFLNILLIPPLSIWDKVLLCVYRCLPHRVAQAGLRSIAPSLTLLSAGLQGARHLLCLAAFGSIRQFVLTFFTSHYSLLLPSGSQNPPSICLGTLP